MALIAYTKELVFNKYIGMDLGVNSGYQLDRSKQVRQSGLLNLYSPRSKWLDITYVKTIC